MCLHIGNTPHHGHYTSIVRNIKDKIWRHYNDADVTVLTKELDKRFFYNATPYICFYESESVFNEKLNDLKEKLSLKIKKTVK